MKLILKLSLLAFMLFLCTWCKAQDILVKTDSTKIECVVSKISEYEISYKAYDNQDGPSYVVQKVNVAYIIYKNGKKEIITAPPFIEVVDPSLVLKNSIRVNGSAPIFGHISAEYERQIKPQISITSELGYIGFRSDFLYGYKLNGFYGTTGVRVYNKDFERPYRSQKADVVAGAYLFTKLHAETFSARLERQSSASLSRYNFRNSALGISLGGGASIHFFRYLNIDIGGGFGYNIIQTHLPEPTIYNINIDDSQTYFSQLNLSTRNNLSVEMTIALGFNF